MQAELFVPAAERSADGLVKIDIKCLDASDSQLFTLQRTLSKLHCENIIVDSKAHSLSLRIPQQLITTEVPGVSFSSISVAGKKLEDDSSHRTFAELARHARDHALEEAIAKISTLRNAL